MTALHCPATLLVARHAEAAFVEDAFSDEGGSLSAEGRAQAGALAEGLRGRRIASVWCSDVSRAVQTAEIVAARLDVGVVNARPALREVYVGTLLGQPFDYGRIEDVCRHWYAGELDRRFEEGESGAEVVERHRSLLEEIADAHRGETALVVGHQTALGIAVPALVPELDVGWAREHELDNTETVELEHDGDGWSLRRWSGERA